MNYNSGSMRYRKEENKRFHKYFDDKERREGMEVEAHNSRIIDLTEEKKEEYKREDSPQDITYGMITEDWGLVMDESSFLSLISTIKAQRWKWVIKEKYINLWRELCWELQWEAINICKEEANKESISSLKDKLMRKAKSIPLKILSLLGLEDYYYSKEKSDFRKAFLKTYK